MIKAKTRKYPGQYNTPDPVEPRMAKQQNLACPFVVK